MSKKQIQKTETWYEWSCDNDGCGRQKQQAGPFPPTNWHEFTICSANEMKDDDEISGQACSMLCLKELLENSLAVLDGEG